MPQKPILITFPAGLCAKEWRVSLLGFVGSWSLGRIGSVFVLLQLIFDNSQLFLVLGILEGVATILLLFQNGDFVHNAFLRFLSPLSNLCFQSRIVVHSRAFALFDSLLLSESLPFRFSTSLRQFAASWEDGGGFGQFEVELGNFEIMHLLLFWQNLKSMYLLLLEFDQRVQNKL